MSADASNKQTRAWEAPRIEKLGRMENVAGAGATSQQVSKNGTNPGS